MLTRDGNAEAFGGGAQQQLGIAETRPAIEIDPFQARGLQPERPVFRMRIVAQQT